MIHSIITNCSSRKRDTGVPPLVPVLSPNACIAEVARSWVDQVKKSRVRVAPLDLYQGRSFTECRVATRHTNADLYVVSAGFGLINQNDLIPNYSLTISEGTGSLLKWLSSHGMDSANWWTDLCHALGTALPISSLVNGRPENSQTLIALPSSYLEMVAADLELVHKNRLKDLRIFTSNAGAKTLPEKLRSTLMPYDERLEGVAHHNGTRSDFPQRALKHFVVHLQAHGLDLDVAKDAVRVAMKKAVKPTILKRNKAPDERIIELIRTHWKKHDGSASKLLRFLRDDANVACEQSRFSGIWRKVKDDQSTQNSRYV